MKRPVQKKRSAPDLAAANQQLQEGVRLLAVGQPAEAKQVLTGLVALFPKEFVLHKRLAEAAFALEDFAAAAKHFEDAIALNPDRLDTLANLGVVYRRLGRYDEALACQQKAIRINPDYAEAYSNLGFLMHEVFKQPEAAIAAYEKAIALKPSLHDSFYNLGNVYMRRREFAQAITNFKQAVALKPDYGVAYANMAISYGGMKNYPEAVKHYQRAVDLQVQINFLKGHYIYTKLHVGDWQGFDELVSDLIRDIRAGKPVSNPFATLALVDDPQVQLQAITTFAGIDQPANSELPPPVTHPEHQKIRIGYFSTDYWNHPVAHLMLGLFNAHDRSRFEVIAFSLGNPIKDQWHQRVKDSVDQFIEIQDLSDKEVAELARSMEIDIAVDLNGFTELCRTGIFAQRAAPVQVSYIGYLGTMGAPYIDYLVTDETIVPPEARPFYTEKMIYLPSYQINDPEQRPSERPMTRAEFGLPEDAFVFCAFNNNYKITPPVFESWMRILNRVPHGVLWLYVSNEQAQENLRRFAAEHGVAPERLVFAKKILLEDHLARQRLGDLFLDTLPYNAGATASNALRVGLPVLTRTGKSFAGRMGSSLLKSVGLPELITATEQDYEDKAVQLASDPVLMQSIRQKLAANLPTSALFDNQAFARNIETAFQTIHQRACRGLPPMHVNAQAKPMAQDVNAQFQEGKRLQNAGQLEEAQKIFLGLAKALPNQSPIHVRLGQVAFALGKLEDAAGHFKAALKCNPKQADVLSNLGVVYRRLNRFDSSLAYYQKALQIDPKGADVWFNMGFVLESMERLDESENAFRQVIQLDSSYKSAHFFLGNLLLKLARPEEAVASYEQAIASDTKVAESYCNMGSALKQLNRFDEARQCYEKSLALDPSYLDTFYNLGNLLCQLGRLSEATEAYERCLALKPDHLETLGNYASALTKLQRLDEAETLLDRALLIDPSNHSTTLNRGNIDYLKKNHAAALAFYERALEIEPDAKFLRGQIIYTKLHVGDWQGFDGLVSDLTRDIKAGKPVSAPFATLALVDDPQVQQQAITTFAVEKFPCQDDLPPPLTHLEHDRIRIGYFSTDYRNHPVAHLMLGLFTAHDRSRFEVIAFSLGNPIKDQWHQRVKDSVDQFIEIRDMSDKEVAELARSMEIDIAVDLNGFTENCRAGIFAQRAAPVQVSYIGYLGTMGAPYIDYLVTDETIVPPEARPFYTEKMIYLPSYQINDPEQRPSERPMTRAEFGLPEDAFVFCAFNNNYKITPPVFESWMRILNRVPHGVLWLYVSNEQAQENLRRFAAEHGVAPERLVFAKKILLEDHLARQRLGDLFLDTLPYNAGATASNALRVGLPVLTRTGKSFAGRMGSSLLKAVGLPELITATVQEYEDKAVQLASDPALMQSIRQKLASNLPNSALFDNQAFARNIETAFQTVHQRACQGLPPMHVKVQD